MSLNVILVSTVVDNMYKMKAMIDSNICTCYMVKLTIDVRGYQCEDVYTYEVDNLDYNL
ncbi:hypothetical protein BDBG_17825, partial [Blastomyces gilchristii SLH14081]